MLDNIDPGFGERCCFESYLGKRNETLLVQNRVSFKAMVQRAIFYHEASAAAKHKQMPLRTSASSLVGAFLVCPANSVTIFGKISPL